MLRWVVVTASARDHVLREQFSSVALPLLSGPLTASVDVGAGRTLGPGVALQLSELLLEAAMSQAHNTCA